MHGEVVHGMRYRAGVYRVGNTGVYRVPSQLAPRGANPPAKRAPEAQRAGVGGWVQRACSGDGGRDGPAPTPAGPGRSPRRPPWCRTLQIAASWPIWARFDLISLEYSQNGQVSPKYVEKASNSPCFQNELQKSPLGILGFPF